MSNILADSIGTAEKAYNYDPIVAGSKYIEDFLFSEKPAPVKIFVFKPSLNIQGIPFTVSEGGGSFTLFNPQWPSLTTSDSSLGGAMKNAVELVHDVSEQYVYASEDNLTEDAIEFRKYLLSRIFH